MNADTTLDIAATRTLTLASGGSGTLLSLAGGTVVDGPGQILMAGTGINTISITTGTTTLASILTIRWPKKFDVIASGKRVEHGRQGRYLWERRVLNRRATEPEGRG